MSDPRAALLADAHHDMLRAQYDKMKTVHDRVDKLREGMDRLLNLGDMVAPEDVIKEAGLVVGHGSLSASQMAEFLVSMPNVGGAPLSEWIKGVDQRVRVSEQGIAARRASVQHHLGVAAIRAMAAQHLAGAPSQPVQTPQSNALAITNPTGEPA